MISCGRLRDSQAAMPHLSFCASFGLVRFPFHEDLAFRDLIASQPKGDPIHMALPAHLPVSPTRRDETDMFGRPFDHIGSWLSETGSVAPGQRETGRVWFGESAGTAGDRVARGPAQCAGFARTHLKLAIKKQAIW